MNRERVELNLAVEWICRWMFEEGMSPETCLGRIRYGKPWAVAVRRWLRLLSGRFGVPPTYSEVAESLRRAALPLPTVLTYGVLTSLPPEVLYREPPWLAASSSPPTDHGLPQTQRALFQLIADHLLRQASRCEGSLRDEAGRRSPVGLLIPDGVYHPSMEAMDALTVIHRTHCLGGLEPFLLFELQHCHDTVEPSRWEQRLRSIGKRFRDV